ncbi:MAG: hypothetical protein R3B54_07690 [Bdellovibrionota bacterium]
MWIGDFFRKHSLVLIALTLIATPVQAKPRTRTLLFASAFICVSTFVITALLHTEDPVNAQIHGSHEVTEVSNVEPLRVSLLEEEGNAATFSIVSGGGEVPAIKVFDKNRLQRLYASSIISTIREKIDDPDLYRDLRRIILKSSFRERIERRENGNAELVLTAGRESNGNAPDRSFVGS